MSKYSKTIKSEHYWNAKGQSEIYSMLKEHINQRGDAAKLAKKIGKSPGYVSQLLSGDSELNPTWKKIVKFCLALDKVPILEIKDASTFLEEQIFKTSFVNLNKSIHCYNPNSSLLAEDSSTEFLELQNFMDFNSPRRIMKYNDKNEITINESFDEYELI